jgi:GNAT superfamily N-acetyltransferase
VDRQAVLAAFDEQIRRNPPSGAGSRIEHDDRVTRHVSDDNSWNSVIWSDLEPTNAEEIIDQQIRRFADATEPWEWKYYSYDQPPDLPDRLLAAGFTPDEEEALLVAEIADLAVGVSPPSGVDLQPVVDDAGIEALVAVQDEVFGGDHSAIGRAIRIGLTHEPTTLAAVVAWARDTPISSGRVEFHHDTEFASIWGGGTLPEWRGRGVFRSLVAHRAALAAEQGYRYLQVDALPPSRPILQRLGFHELAITTPFMHPAGQL